MGRFKIAAIKAADNERVGVIETQLMFSVLKTYKAVKSEQMSGSAVVIDRESNEYFSFEDHFRKGDDDDASWHVEDSLFKKLQQQFPSRKLPNNTKLVIYTYWSPCQRCFAAYEDDLKNWIEHSMDIIVNVTWSHDYTGTKKHRWSDSGTMQARYDQLASKFGTTTSSKADRHVIDRVKFRELNAAMSQYSEYLSASAHYRAEERRKGHYIFT